MRLMHRDDTSIGRLPRSFQHGGNLNRVVAIVIDDRHTIYFAHTCKAAVNTTERG